MVIIIVYLQMNAKCTFIKYTIYFLTVVFLLIVNTVLKSVIQILFID